MKILNTRITPTADELLNATEASFKGEALKCDMLKSYEDMGNLSFSYAIDYVTKGDFRPESEKLLADRYAMMRSTLKLVDEGQLNRDFVFRNLEKNKEIFKHMSAEEQSCVKSIAVNGSGFSKLLYDSPRSVERNTESFLYTLKYLEEDLINYLMNKDLEVAVDSKKQIENSVQKTVEDKKGKGVKQQNRIFYFEPESMRDFDFAGEYTMKGFMYGKHLSEEEKKEFWEKQQVEIKDDTLLWCNVHFPKDKDGVHTTQLENEEWWFKVELDKGAKPIALDIGAVLDDTNGSFIVSKANEFPYITVNYSLQELQALSEVVNDNRCMPDAIEKHVNEMNAMQRDTTKVNLKENRVKQKNNDMEM